MQIAYKILKIENGVLKSISNQRNPFILEYKLGEITIPKIGKMFCFKELNDAKRYLIEVSGFSWDKYSLYECIVEGLIEMPFYADSYPDIQDFWEKGEHKDIQLIRGTYGCDSLYLTKEIK